MTRIVTVDENNLAEHPQTICFINPKHPSYHLKTAWLQERFREGMKIKLLYEEGEKRPAGFIEYVAGEYCWRAVTAPGYLFIHCIWVSSSRHKGRGTGSLLLQECLDEAAGSDLAGVAVMTSDGPFMADRSLFEKHGFTLADQTGKGYQLMVRPRKPGPLPSFRNWQAELSKFQGLHIIYSRQCPWVARFVREVPEKLKAKGIQITVTELKSAKEAQAAPSPYAVFNLVWNGRLLADHYISETRLNNLLKKIR